MAYAAQDTFSVISRAVQEALQARQAGNGDVAMRRYEQALDAALREIMRLLDQPNPVACHGGVLEAVYSAQCTANPIGVFGVPRSGTTFVVSALLQLTGYPLHDVCPQPPGLSPAEHWLRSHDLDAARLYEASMGGRPFLMHTHPMPTAANLDLIRRFGVRVVFNSRSLPDCLVSLSEVLEKQIRPVLPAMLAAGGAQWAPLRLAGVALERYIALSPQDRLDFLLDFAAPWFIQYLAGWEEVLPCLPDAVHIPYGQIVGNEIGILAGLRAAFGLSYADSDIASYVEAMHRDRPFYLAQGIVGRGRAAMSERQLEHLRDLAASYAGTDFAERYCV